MNRIFIALVGSLLISYSASSASNDAVEPHLDQIVKTAPRANPFGLEQYVTGYCCRVCSRGKACGDTCIAADKICHVGPGCACDG
jgi:hypothetical protein